MTSTRTATDAKILSELAAIVEPSDIQETDSLQVTILPNSGLLSVSSLYSHLSIGTVNGLKNATKLSTGEPIAETEEGQAYIARHIAAFSEYCSCAHCDR